MPKFAIYSRFNSFFASRPPFNEVDTEKYEQFLNLKEARVTYELKCLHVILSWYALIMTKKCQMLSLIFLKLLQVRVPKPHRLIFLGTLC